MTSGTYHGHINRLHACAGTNTALIFRLNINVVVEFPRTGHVIVNYFNQKDNVDKYLLTVIQESVLFISGKNLVDVYLIICEMNSWV